MKHALILACVPVALWADPAVITDIEVRQTGETWRFDVTVAHADTGWEDYADGWEVRLPDGTVLGRRTLFHPHVEEQPFTRSLTGVAIPEGTAEVELFVSENVGGWSDVAYPVTLPGS